MEALLTSASERPLDPVVGADLTNMTRNHPAFIDAFDSFSSLILCRPFTVEMNHFEGWTTADELKEVISHYWMRWARDLRYWCRTYGLCPWKIIPVEGHDVHAYPIVPAFENGFITTHVDPVRNEQHFSYYSTVSGVAVKDESMKWTLTEWAPSPLGKYRSPVHSLLSHYLTERTVREAAEIAATHAARPVHMFSQKQAHDDHTKTHLPALHDYGEAHVGAVADSELRYFQRVAEVRTNAFRQDLMQTASQNLSANAQTAQRAVLSEPSMRFRNRLGDGVAERSYVLPPNFSVSNAELPRAVVDLHRVDETLTAMVNSVIGVPLEMTQSSSATKAASIAGIFFLVAEKLKRELSFLEGELKRAFMLAYGPRLHEHLGELKKYAVRHSYTKKDPSFGKLLQLDYYNMITVKLDCVPLLTAANAETLWRNSVISKNTYAEIARTSYNMPESMIDVTATPDRDPQYMLAQQQLAAKASTAASNKQPKPAKQKLGPGIPVVASEQDAGANEEN